MARAHPGNASGLIRGSGTMPGMDTVAVMLRPWGAADLPLLERLLGDPEMMAHVGGPESPEEIRSRQRRYSRPDADGVSRQFAIMMAQGLEAVGWVGYWPREWRGGAVWEAGWSVLPELQGRGLATAATRSMLVKAAGERTRRYVHAFPAVGNPASNAVCAKAGFALLGELNFEYPPGHVIRCNDWRFDLAGGTGRWAHVGR